MKGFKSIIAACVAAVVVCAAPAIPVVQDAVTIEAEAASPKLSLSKTTLLKGANITLKVKNYSGSVTWSSSNKKIATVNKNGKVVAKSCGKTTITAKINGQELTCKVTVSPTISVNKKSVTIKKGKYKDIKVTFLRPGTIYAEGATDIVSAEWIQYKGHVATLRIYGKAKGTAKIKFTNTYDKKTCSIKVTVK